MTLTTGSSSSPTPQFYDYVKRAVVDTDIPTFENYFTKRYPTHQPSRYKHDSTVSNSRPYAGDDMLGMQQVIAMARLPNGWGTYSNGIIVLYLSTGFSDATLYHGHGSVDGEDVTDGYWPFFQQGLGDFDSKYRIAVHKPVRSPYEYATGWQIVDDLTDIGSFAENAGLPREGDGAYYPFSSTWNGVPAPVADFPNSIYGHWANGDGGTHVDDGDGTGGDGTLPFYNVDPAKFITQEVGDTVLLVLGTTLWQIKPDLTILHLTDGSTMIANGWEYPVNFNLLPSRAKRYYLTDEADPRLFVLGAGWVFVVPFSSIAGLGTHIDIGGTSFTHSGITGDTTAYGVLGFGAVGATFQFIGPELTSLNSNIMVEEFKNAFDFGAVTYEFVHPWYAGRYDPPEIWAFVPVDVNRTTMIYRNKYESGKYQPPGNGRGLGTPIGGHQYGEPQTIGTITFPYTPPGIGLDRIFTGDFQSDDPDYAGSKYYLTGTKGTNEFPSLNPKGYGYDWNWFKPENIVGTIGSLFNQYYHDNGPQTQTFLPLSQRPWGATLPFPGGDDYHATYFSSSLGVKIVRGTQSGTLHALLVDGEGIGGPWNPIRFLGSGDTWAIAGNNSGSGVVGVIATSVDDGKTWTLDYPKTMPFARNDTVGGMSRRGMVFMGGVTASLEQQDPVNCFCIDNAGHCLWGIMDYWEYRDPGNARHNYWDRLVDDQGAHIALWFMGLVINSGTSQGGPGNVLYSRAAQPRIS